MQSAAYGFNEHYADEEPVLEALSSLSGRVLLEFGAPWCGHCMAARAAVQEMMSAHPQTLHVKVHDGRGKPLGRAFRVKLWPTLLVIEQGEELARAVRPTTVADLAALDALLSG